MKTREGEKSEGGGDDKTMLNECLRVQGWIQAPDCAEVADVRVEVEVDDVMEGGVVFVGGREGGEEL
jgi:hypothetical protein